jgi:DNA-binding beta-propeller fold protein YncE
MAFDSTQRVLYGVDRATGTLLAIDPNNASATAMMAWPLSGLGSLAYEPGTPGRLRAFDDAGRMLVTITLGLFTAVQEPVPPLQGIGGLAFDFERGVLWGTEPATGNLVRVWEAPQAAPAFTEATAMAQVGPLFYVFDLADHELLRMDPAQGTVEHVADLGNRQIEAMTFQPSTGRLLASDVTSGSLLSIDPATGMVQVVGPLGYADVRGLAFHEATGVLYGFDRATQKLLMINPASAVVAQETVLGQSFADVQDLCWDAEHGTLLAVDAQSRMLLQIDAGTALVGMAVAIEPAGARALVYLGSDVVAVLDDATDTLVRIDRTTGVTLP